MHNFNVKIISHVVGPFCMIIVFSCYQGIDYNFYAYHIICYGFHVHLWVLNLVKGDNIHGHCDLIASFPNFYTLMLVLFFQYFALL